MNIFQYIQEGGVIMYILLLLNIIGFSIMIHKCYVFNCEKKNTGQIIDGIQEQLRLQGPEQKDTPALIELARGEISLYLNPLENGLNTIKVIAIISPLLGLLGTVVGVFLAFNAISQTGLSDPSHFAKGISLALITTVGGMMVALPHLIGHHYLLSVLDKIEGKLERDLFSQIL